MNGSGPELGRGRGLLARRTIAIALASLALSFFFGITFFVLVEFMPADMPLFNTFLRAAPATALVLVALRLLGRSRASRHDVANAALLGVLNFTVVNALLTAGAFKTPGGVASVLAGSWPVLVGILSILVLKQRPGWLKWIAMSVAVLGLILVSVPEFGLAGSRLGAAQLLGSSVALAMATVATQRVVIETASALEFVCMQGVFGGGVALVAAALMENPWVVQVDGNIIFGTLVLSVGGGVVAYVALFYLTKTLGALRAAAVAATAPVVAILFGVALQGETMSLLQGVGCLVAVIGCVVTAASPMGAGTDPSRKISKVWYRRA